MFCSFERCVDFIRRTFTSTTFIELLYRLLSVAFIAFAYDGAGLLKWLTLAVPLMVLVTSAEMVERWLSVPHVTVVSLATVLVWLQFSVFHKHLEWPIDNLVSPGRLKLLGVYGIPLLVIAYAAATVTLSDVWKAQMDISILLAFLPTVVETIVYSLLHLITGEPFIWGLMTALALSVTDHNLVYRRASVIERTGKGLRYDVPQLMRSSMLINVIATLLIFTLTTQFTSLCKTTYNQYNGTWTVNSTTCISGAFTSQDAVSVLERLAGYGGSLTIGLVAAIMLYQFAKRTGLPKTQTLAIVFLSALPLLFHSTISKYVNNTDLTSENILHKVHGAEPLCCFLVAACIMYGWRKSGGPNTTVMDNLKQVRNNIVALLYILSVCFHCYLGFLVLVYCVSSDSTFLGTENLPEAYLHEFRHNRKNFLVVTAVSAACASLAKCATAVAVLKWKYRMKIKVALYFGASSIGKGVISGALCCSVLLAKLTVTKGSDKSPVPEIDAMQLSYAVNMIIATVVANLAVNPLAVFITAMLSRNWASLVDQFTREVELS